MFSLFSVFFFIQYLILDKKKSNPYDSSHHSYHILQKELLQSNEEHCLKQSSSWEWRTLCTNNEAKIFMEANYRIMQTTSKLNIVQIGAHVGFEKNDPLATGIISLIDSIPEKYRSRFRWTFVEPSPPNFKRLMKNLKKNSHICEMKSINAGVISDSTNSLENDLVFYSLSDTIDPETGFDSLSKKKLPKFITQVSSFSKSPILSNEKVFSSRGLNVNDYIIETKVPTKKFSILMDEILRSSVDGHNSSPFLVLIDTEGFDCDIVQGISFHSKFLPKFLVFEINQCPKEKYEKTKKHLEQLGYMISKKRENAVGILKENDKRLTSEMSK